MFARTVPVLFAITISISCSACAGSKKDEWSNMDYSKVYKAAGQRDIDTGYKAPSVIGCVDDDLYNCK